MRTPDILLHRLRVTFEAARDPGRATAAAAYMRNQFPFLGIRAPQQAAIYREVTANLPPPAGDVELATVAFACWELPEREYQHFGTTYLQRLVTTKSWWDTGPLVATHPELRAVMDRWVEAENIWLARVAILHRERYRERTDSELLFAYCLRRAADREFFIREAIGWALRSYAKVAPDVVAQFLTADGEALSGLSRREAERGVAIGRNAR